MHYMVGFNVEADARMLAALNHTILSPWFTFRHILRAMPVASIMSMMCIVAGLGGYALRIAERSGQEEFGYIANAMWCVVITMTTVGCKCSVALIVNYLQQ